MSVTRVSVFVRSAGNDDLIHNSGRRWCHKMQQPKSGVEFLRNLEGS